MQGKRVFMESRNFTNVPQITRQATKGVRLQRSGTEYCLQTLESHANGHQDVLETGSGPVVEISSF
jgi:hypothetical protein